MRPLVWIGYHQTVKIDRLHNYLVPLICARQSDWPAHLVIFRIWVRVIYTCTKWQHPSPEKAAGGHVSLFRSRLRLEATEQRSSASPCLSRRSPRASKAARDALRCLISDFWRSLGVQGQFLHIVYTFLQASEV